MPLSICHVVTAFPRSKDDIITPWLIKLLEEMKKNDLTPSVFVSSYKGLKDEEYEGIKVKRFRYFFRKYEDLTHDETTPDRIKSRPWYFIHLCFYMLLGWINLLIFVKKSKFDIVQIHWPLPHALWGFLLKKISPEVRIFHRYYGAEVRWLKHSFPVLIPVFRYLLKMADGASANSSVTADAVKEILGREISYIPDGIPFEIPDKHNDLGYEILFVGRLVERKGLPVLLKAIKILKEKYNLKLVVVGQGSEEKHLKKLALDLDINENVSFLGNLHHKGLDERYNKAYMFVLPAVIDSKGDTEGLGVVLLEAMAYKRPVIGSNLGGIVDIIIDNKTGLLVKPDDPEELANAIEKLWTDRKLAEKFAENGFKWLEEKFGWNSIVEGYKKLYGKECNEKSSDS
ncbi:MAG: glycosyltransferase family 4 protein [Candidatus Coatesbacteria bacterium]|nr:glycosyltransferase family 4 protein [Candidatus Coatesbacteria bacterium]